MDGQGYLVPRTTGNRRNWKYEAIGSHLPILFCLLECEVSEESSGEAEIEQEASDLEDLRELHPGLLIYKAAQARNLPLMAEALANGAEINWVNDEDENKTPLIQAVMGVRCASGWEWEVLTLVECTDHGQLTASYMLLYPLSTAG